MNWLILMMLFSGTAAAKQPTEAASEAASEPTSEPAPDQPPAPNLELLLFLAEWEDTDTDQWLDPETFATDDSMNQQLDTQKAQHHETDPDHP